MNKRNFKIEEDPLFKNAQLKSKIYPEVLLLVKFLQTNPQNKNMNIIYYDLYYTAIKNRVEKEVVNDQYEDNEFDYIRFNDFITLNHNIGIKPRETLLR